MTAIASPITEPVVITAYDLIVTAEPIATSVIAGHELLRAQIAAIAVEDRAKTFNYRTEGTLARSHVYKIRKIKATVEAKRKESKAEAVAFGKRVDAAATAMTLELEELIAPHQKALDEIDAAEKARIAKHTDSINRLVLAQTFYAGKDSTAIREALAKVKEFDTATLQEFKAEGDAKLIATILALESELAFATKREAEAAELVALRAAAAAREEADRLDRIARDAELVEVARHAAEGARIIAAAAEATSRVENEAKDEAARVAAVAKAKLDAARLAEEKAKRLAAEAKEREFRTLADLAAASAREQVRLEREAAAKAEFEVRALAAAKAASENRATVIARIAEDISRSGNNAAEIAEAIVSGMVRNVVVTWEV